MEELPQKEVVHQDSPEKMKPEVAKATPVKAGIDKQAFAEKRSPLTALDASEGEVPVALVHRWALV